VSVLGSLGAAGRVLLVAPAVDERLRLSARNIPTVDVILADSLNVVDLLRADVIVIEQPALARMEEVYGDRASDAARAAAEPREEVPA
jgi:large subunit ribosomal protein L4